MLNILIIVTIEQLTIIFDEQRVFHIPLKLLIIPGKWGAKRKPHTQV